MEIKITNEREYLAAKKKLQELSICIDEYWNDLPYKCGFQAGILSKLEVERDLLKETLREFDEVSTRGRTGDWMPVFSCRRFWLLDPRPEDIDIKDIITGLSNSCRYNGHVSSFYSISQHSVLAAMLASPKNKLHALFHDASESYIGDVISPLKHLLKDYHAIERKIMEAIAQKFGFDLDAGEAEVKQIDERLLATEVRDLVPAGVLNWKNKVQPYSFTILGWSPERAAFNFELVYEEIKRGGNIQSALQFQF